MVSLFCRHNRLTANCPICSRELEAELKAEAPPRPRPCAVAAARTRRSSGGSPARRGGGVVTRRLARAEDDGYRNQARPRPAGDRRRRAARGRAARGGGAARAARCLRRRRRRARPRTGDFHPEDTQTEEGLLLNTASGIFFEFIPAGEIFNENPTRLSLHDVKVGENYALIINNNAGLWGYNIGDTVKFLSTAPYRIVVTGRTKHFISAFGEHVIGEEVEHSLLKVAEEEGVRITEFTVAPMIQEGEGKSYHQWFIEFENEPQNLNAFAIKLMGCCGKKIFITMTCYAEIYCSR